MLQAEHIHSDRRASDSKTNPARGLGIARPSRLAKVGAKLHCTERRYTLAPSYIRTDKQQHAGGVPASPQTLPSIRAVRSPAACEQQPRGKLPLPGASRQPAGGAVPPGSRPEDPQPGKLASTRPSRFNSKKT